MGIIGPAAGASTPWVARLLRATQGVLIYKTGIDTFIEPEVRYYQIPGRYSQFLRVIIQTVPVRRKRDSIISSSTFCIEYRLLTLVNNMVVSTQYTRIKIQLLFAYSSASKCYELFINYYYSAFILLYIRFFLSFVHSLLPITYIYIHVCVCVCVNTATDIILSKIWCTCTCTCTCTYRTVLFP